MISPGGKHDAYAGTIVFGHTHVPYHRAVDGVYFVDTGSVGRPKDGDPRAGYCVLAFDGSALDVRQIRLEYDVETSCSRLIAAGLRAYFADDLRTGGNTPKLDETPEFAERGRPRPLRCEFALN